jgi:murein DD-endopeptidase MepM/ murein hydrolase activator NlpD
VLAGPSLLAVGGLVPGGRLSSGYGWRGPSLGGGGSVRHEGIDITAPKGTPIRAAADGTVKSITTRGDYGRLVVLSHAGGFETVYAHLAHTTKSLAIGAPVRQGDVIGYVGATGNATGPHLHFEVRRDGTPIDPLSLPQMKAAAN